MNKIDVRALMFREMKRKGLSTADLSRLLGIPMSTPYGWVSRKTISINLLGTLCEKFEFNFFREIAERYPYPEPPIKSDSVFEKQLSDLQQRNTELEIEVKILRQTLKELVQK